MDNKLTIWTDDGTTFLDPSEGALFVAPSEGLIRRNYQLDFETTPLHFNINGGGVISCNCNLCGAIPGMDDTVYYISTLDKFICTHCIVASLVAAGKIEDPKEIDKGKRRQEAIDYLRGDNPWGI